MDTPAPKLSEKRRAFVEHYMGSCRGNATAAAKAAGYAPKGAHVQASKLLQRADIKAAIAARGEEDPAVMDRKELLRWLTNTIRGELKIEFMMWSGSAHVRTTAPADWGGRLEAAKLLAKVCGFEQLNLNIELRHAQERREQAREASRNPKARAAAEAFVTAVTEGQ